MNTLILLLLATPAASLHAHSDEVCSCMNFKSAYFEHNVKCGQGYELPDSAMLARQVLPDLNVKDGEVVPSGNDIYDEFCTRMYMRMDFPACFNKKFGTPVEPWCYVSAKCPLASQVPETDVAVKTCSEGDKFMDKTSPDVLNNLGKQFNLETGLLGKLSYAMEPEKWSQVEASSDLPDDLLQQTHVIDSLATGVQWEETTLDWSQDAAQKINEVRARNRPTIFDADSGHGGGTVLNGDYTYAFSFDKGYHCVGCGEFCNCD